MDILLPLLLIWFSIGLLIINYFWFFIDWLCEIDESVNALIKPLLFLFQMIILILIIPSLVLRLMWWVFKDANGL